MEPQTEEMQSRPRGEDAEQGMLEVAKKGMGENADATMQDDPPQSDPREHQDMVVGSLQSLKRRVISQAAFLQPHTLCRQRLVLHQ